MRLTDRDQEIIQVLASRLRILSLEQLAETWWATAKDPIAAARRRLHTLVECDFLACFQVQALELPEISAPVLRWRPGMQEPNLGSAAWQLQHRWQGAARTTRVFLATRQASKLFGGRAVGNLKRQFQATHDLGVAAMYLRLRKDRPELIHNWIGEDVYASKRKGQKLPDAVIAKSPNATPQLILEFGGSYDKVRLTAFHLDCEQRALAYEVW